MFPLKPVTLPIASSKLWISSPDKDLKKIASFTVWQLNLPIVCISVYMFFFLLQMSVYILLYSFDKYIVWLYECIFDLVTLFIFLSVWMFVFLSNHLIFTVAWFTWYSVWNQELSMCLSIFLSIYTPKIINFNLANYTSACT